jgi:hypothetical protein
MPDSATARESNALTPEWWEDGLRGEGSITKFELYTDTVVGCTFVRVSVTRRENGKPVERFVYLKPWPDGYEAEGEGRPTDDLPVLELSDSIPPCSVHNWSGDECKRCKMVRCPNHRYIVGEASAACPICENST